MPIRLNRIERTDFDDYRGYTLALGDSNKKARVKLNLKPTPYVSSGSLSGDKVVDASIR